MSTKKTISLIDYAQVNAKPSCTVCVLQERDEIDEAYRKGINRRAILKWLWEIRDYEPQTIYDEKGTPTGLSANMLDKHLTGGHHLRKLEDV